MGLGFPADSSEWVFDPAKPAGDRRMRSNGGARPGQRCGPGGRARPSDFAGPGPGSGLGAAGRRARELGRAILLAGPKEQ